VTATPGNHQVSLSWTASPDGPTNYNVYRAQSASGPYTRVATNFAGTSFLSTSLTNCSDYYFFVTAFKSSFEGAWSHFNDGCGTGGSCLRATPMNPSAPSAPTGLVATDNENGGTVAVQWSPNASGDDAQEYRLYYGTTPNPAGAYISVTTGTSALVSGLVNNTTYYFAVSAVNCSHGEGPKSVATVVAVPHRIEGIKPPNGIDDLKVFRSASNLRLEWTPPATNIYAQPYPFGTPPTTLASQEVYSGTTPTFAIDAAHKIGTVVCPCATPSTFTHTNAYSDASRHYYVIVAVDSAGNRSGLTHELPKGIDQLTVTHSGGSLVFSWPAVTLDIDGYKTQIASYSLYGRASTPTPPTTPMKRADIGPTYLLTGNIVGTTTGIPVPAGSLFYYSVIVTDSKGALSPW
jgi:hypothetical protein